MLSSPNIEAIDDFLSLIKEGAAKKPAAKKPAPPAPAAVEPKVLKSTQKKELELWHTWNNGGRKPNDLKPLLQSYEPFLQRYARKFTTVEIPTSAIHAELRKQFLKAVKTYNPERGQLNTWVHPHLNKASRFVKTYQNWGKIPEGNISKIREFKQAKEDLTHKLGYEPDTKTLSDHLKWPQKRVAQMMKEQRKDVPFSHEEGAAELLSPRELEAVRLLQYDTRLSSEERTVYEYVFGINGKPILAPGEIAKKTGLHQSKVSRIRTKLKGLMKEAVEVL